MSVNDFGERFFFHREPAWHPMGIVSQEDTSAVEAFAQLSPYDVVLMPAVLDIGRGYVGTQYQSITRTPVPDDPFHVVFGMVKSQYVILPPAKLCSIYDSEVGKPIETMGCLDKGKTFFFSVELPLIDVNGDKVRQFILICPTYDGNTALPVIVTGVRVECWNTLMAAKDSAMFSYKIEHRAGVEEGFRKTIAFVHSESVKRAAIQGDAYRRMSSFRMPLKLAIAIIEQIYPSPPEPQPYRVDGVTANQLKQYEYYTRYAEETRETVMELYKGAGTGMDMKATAGTAWGLFNAVCEWENYRRYRTLTSRGVEILRGGRAKVMGAAYAILSDVNKLNKIVR